ncbi:Splicing factor, Prp19-binding domain containing protein [Elaphomyces granulatus]
MPPPKFPSTNRGMTANPLKPVKRYRRGKAIAEEPSSEEDEDYEEEIDEQEQRRQREAQRRQQRQRQAAPKAASFPGGALTKAVQDVKIEDITDEEGFITEGDDDGGISKAPKSVFGQTEAPTGYGEMGEEDEEGEEEDTSEEDESTEDEAPRRTLLRPTFIRKDKRKDLMEQSTNGSRDTAMAPLADSTVETEVRQAQRQEKADMLVRDQLEKDAMARTAGRKAWDDDEEIGGDEQAIDDRDGLDPEAEYAAWKLRELKRIKREREAIEAAEKEREEIERRRNLTTEEREREDREYLAKQQEERDTNRGQTGFMQRYFHKGAFFRDELERGGLDKRKVMGTRFADDVSRETLPQYMQIRDMTKLGKKGRTKYKDLRAEDTGRWGEGFDLRRKRNDETFMGIVDDRFLPDRRDDHSRGPTGANAYAVRPRSRSRPRRRSRSKSFSPRREPPSDRAKSGANDARSQHSPRDRYQNDSRDTSHRDTYRDDHRGRRKRSSSPYVDRDKRRRMDSLSPRQ